MYDITGNLTTEHVVYCSKTIIKFLNLKTIDDYLREYYQISIMIPPDFSIKDKNRIHNCIKNIIYRIYSDLGECS